MMPDWLDGWPFWLATWHVVPPLSLAKQAALKRKHLRPLVLLRPRQAELEARRHSLHQSCEAPWSRNEIEVASRFFAIVICAKLWIAAQNSCRLKVNASIYNRSDCIWNPALRRPRPYFILPRTCSDFDQLPHVIRPLFARTPHRLRRFSPFNGKCLEW